MGSTLGSHHGFSDPWLAKGDIASPIEHNRLMFEKIRNPVFIWRTVADCSRIQHLTNGFPGWVVDYLAAFADQVQDLYEQQINDELKNLPQQLAAGLGLKRSGQGVRSSAFDAVVRDQRDYAVAGAVQQKLRENPTYTLQQAACDVAEDRAGKGEDIEVSEVVAASAWRRFFQDTE